MTDRKAHTPGPWTVAPPQMGFSEIRGPNGELIFGLAAGSRDERQSEAVCEANARLIAAAPVLLEALREAERFLDYFANGRLVFAGSGTPRTALAQVQAAIASATGEDQ